jgi:lysophospholipase L1-like esterase
MPRALSRSLLVAWGVLLGLAAAELLARALGPEVTVVFRDTVRPSEDPRLGYELRPGGRDGKYRISAEGLRDHDLSWSKPPGEIRIAAIGDSITYGFGVPRERVWVEQLERLLGARARPGGPRFEVLNLGVPGYNGLQIVERLRRVGLAFEPDLVVYGYSLNDPQDFSFEATALRTMEEERERAMEQAPALRRWLARSRLFLLLREVLLRPRRGQEVPEQMPDDPAFAALRRGEQGAYLRAIHHEGESAQRWTRALDELAGLARERSLPTLVVVFPMFPEDDGDDLADLTAQVTEAARARGLEALDLAPFYAAARRSIDRPLHADFLHPNVHGHRVAALAVLDALCRSQRLRPPDLECSGLGNGDPVEAVRARLGAGPAG